MLEAFRILVVGFSALTYVSIGTGIVQMRGRGHTPQAFAVGMLMLPVSWVLLVALAVVEAGSR